MMDGWGHDREGTWTRDPLCPLEVMRYFLHIDLWHNHSTSIMLLATIVQGISVCTCLLYQAMSSLGGGTKTFSFVSLVHNKYCSGSYWCQQSSRGFGKHGPGRTFGLLMVLVDQLDVELEEVG